MDERERAAVCVRATIGQYSTDRANSVAERWFEIYLPVLPARNSAHFWVGGFYILLLSFPLISEAKRQGENLHKPGPQQKHPYSVWWLYGEVL